jgi:HSP20 family protein
MAMINRWFDQDLLDPFRDVTSLRDAVDRLFEQAVVRPGSLLGPGRGSQVVPMNVYERDGKYIAQVYLPGLDPASIEVTTRQNTLTVHAQMPDPVDTGTTGNQNGRPQVTWLLQEVGGGEVTRSVTLPKAINGDQVQARYEQGVLTIELPVAEHEMPKKITVQAAQTQPQLTASASH